MPNKATTYTYDANGNLASATDPLGRLTQYQYDNLGHLQSLTPPLPAGVTDPSLVKTNYQYDPLGHITEIDAPLGRVTKNACGKSPTTTAHSTQRITTRRTT